MRFTPQVCFPWLERPSSLAVRSTAKFSGFEIASVTMLALAYRPTYSYVDANIMEYDQLHVFNNTEKKMMSRPSGNDLLSIMVMLERDNPVRTGDFWVLHLPELKQWFLKLTDSIYSRFKPFETRVDAVFEYCRREVIANAVMLDVNMRLLGFKRLTPMAKLQISRTIVIVSAEDTDHRCVLVWNHPITGARFGPYDLCNEDFDRGLRYVDVHGDDMYVSMNAISADRVQRARDASTTGSDASTVTADVADVNDIDPPTYPPCAEEPMHDINVIRANFRPGNPWCDEVVNACVGAGDAFDEDVITIVERNPPIGATSKDFYDPIPVKKVVRNELPTNNARFELHSEEDMYDHREYIRPMDAAYESEF